MEYRIENFRWNNDGLFGEDMVTFDFDVITDEPEHYLYRTAIGLDIVLNHLPETDKRLADYISEVRGSIDGWGPKEGKLMNELPDSIDFKKMVYDLFERKGWFLSEYKRWKTIRALPASEHKKIEMIASDLGKGQKALHTDTKNYYDFCESAEKALRGIAVRIYPEILDMNKEKVKEFKYLFTREIMDMQKKLLKFTGE